MTWEAYTPEHTWELIKFYWQRRNVIGGERILNGLIDSWLAVVTNDHVMKVIFLIIKDEDIGDDWTEISSLIFSKPACWRYRHDDMEETEDASPDQIETEDADGSPDQMRGRASRESIYTDALSKASARARRIYEDHSADDDSPDQMKISRETLDVFERSRQVYEDKYKRPSDEHGVDGYHLELVRGVKHLRWWNENGLTKKDVSNWGRSSDHWTGNIAGLVGQQQYVPPTPDGWTPCFRASGRRITAAELTEEDLRRAILDSPDTEEELRRKIRERREEREQQTAIYETTIHETAIREATGNNYTIRCERCEVIKNIPNDFSMASVHQDGGWKTPTPQGFVSAWENHGEGSSYHGVCCDCANPQPDPPGCMPEEEIISDEEFLRLLEEKM